MVSRSTSRDRSRKDRDKQRDKDKERNRDKDKEKDKDRERYRDRHQAKSSRRSRTKSRSKSRTRSRSPHTHRRDRRSSSPSPRGDYLTLGNVKPKTIIQPSSDKPIILDPLALQGKSEEEIEMMKVMGFAGFDTTKGKHVDGSCNAYAINIQQKRRYRQYMNRKGGFNRPLDPIA